jgi:hypothetical protein
VKHKGMLITNHLLAKALADLVYQPNAAGNLLNNCDNVIVNLRHDFDS